MKTEIKEKANQSKRISTITTGDTKHRTQMNKKELESKILKMIEFTKEAFKKQYNKNISDEQALKIMYSIKDEHVNNIITTYLMNLCLN